MMMDKAQEIISKKGKDGAYQLAIDILYQLGNEGHCIWQAFDKEELEMFDGERPNLERIEELQSRLNDVWEYIC